MLNNNKLIFFIKAYWPQILFVVFVILGYYQIAFFETTFKFDAIYNHLPWRFLIVDNLNHGQLPLWNYYHHLGTPIHADPQSGAWYPVVWLISLFGTYDLYTYNAEFIFHVLIAGLGIQYLSITLNQSKSAQLLLSIAYVFSGFFASNSMFLTWIVSAAWIPFIIAQLIGLLRRPDLKNALLLSFFIFLMVSGGYPAFTIVLAYLLFAISFIAWLKSRKFDKILARKQIVFLSLTVLFSTLLSSVVLVSVLSVIPYMPRGEPLALLEASIPPFLPKHLLSFLLPYPFVELKYDETVLFDGSNIYVGILVFALFLSALTHLKSLKIEVVILLIFTILFLFISFGLSTPVYSLAFDYLPGFNFFRFPTIFRFFTILGILIIAGFEFDKLMAHHNFKIILRIFGGFTIFLSFFFIISLFRNHIFHRNDLMDIYSLVLGFSFWDKAFLQSAFQIFIVLIFIISVKYIKSSARLKTIIIICSFVELALSFNIYMPYTITSYKVNFEESNQLLHNNVQDFSLNTNSNIFLNSTKPDSVYLFSHFLCIYKKAVADKGNTFKLNNYYKLKKENRVYYDVWLHNSIFYFARQIHLNSEIQQKTITRIAPHDLFVSASDYKIISKNLIDNESIELLNFNYNSIKVAVKNNKNSYLVFLQNLYPGWRVKVDGKSQKVIKANHSFMSVYLPAGSHDVEFYFRPKIVIWAFWISVISFSTLVFGLIFLSIKKRPENYFYQI